MKLLKEIDVINILKIMNTRVRHQGKSSQEMLFKREMMENKDIVIKDKELADKQQANRKKNSKYQEKFKSKSSKIVEDQLKVSIRLVVFLLQLAASGILLLEHHVAAECYGLLRLIPKVHFRRNK